VYEDIGEQGAEGNIWYKREGTTLNKDELLNFCPSRNIIRVIELRIYTWSRHVTRIAKMRNTYKILVGKTLERTSDS
jgi:hypothetical protein